MSSSSGQLAKGKGKAKGKDEYKGKGKVHMEFHDKYEAEWQEVLSTLHPVLRERVLAANSGKGKHKAKGKTKGSAEQSFLEGEMLNPG